MPGTPALRVSGNNSGAGFSAVVIVTVAALFSPVGTADVGRVATLLSTPTIDLRHDSLLDEVNYAPNANGGGFLEPQARQRFTATTLSLNLPELGRGALRIGVASHRLVSLRDDLQVYGLRTDASWRLSQRKAAMQLRALFSVSTNRSNAFDKNSWTEVEGATLQHTRIVEPSDLQASIGLGASGAGVAGVHLNAFARLGATQVRHDNVSGSSQDHDGCRYNIKASGEGASIKLVEPCGQIHAYSEVYPDEQGLSDRYGIAPSRDLDWQAAWLETGAGAAWSGERLSLVLGYRYRRYRRDGIDERIEATGGRARRGSHVLSVEAGWAITRRVLIAAGMDWRVAPWLDELPLTYNRFTAHRQDAELPSFRLSLIYGFGAQAR